MVHSWLPHETSGKTAIVRSHNVLDDNVDDLFF